MLPYNPYWNNYNYPSYQQQVSTLSGRIVDNFDSLTANDVPMDNTGAVFIKRDGSEIMHKIWNNNGMISTTLYKPILDANMIQVNKVSSEDKNLNFDALMKRFDTLENLITRKRGEKNDSTDDTEPDVKSGKAGKHAAG